MEERKMRSYLANELLDRLSNEYTPSALSFERHGFYAVCCLMLFILILSTQVTAQTTVENEYIVVAQLNLWYFGPGCYGGFEDYDCEGNSVISITPYLGRYYSSDPDVIRQQIDWAAEYGVDAFSIEWVSPRYQPGSLEENMDDHFLQAPNLSKIRWCIFYDFNLRLMWDGKSIADGIDFNNEAIADTFVADFVHFGKKYFSHPQYLTVDGRPIIYIWNTLIFFGQLEETLQSARDSLAEMGHDVFIAGDEIHETFDPAHSSLFDANTTFTMLIPGVSRANMDSAAIGINAVFQMWKENIRDLKVRNREDYVILQPAWAPQYNDSLFKIHNNLGEPSYVPAESKNQVVHMAEVARSYAHPTGTEAEKIVWLNTFNNWAETTTIEPTIASGPKYPAANYQFDMLEVVKEVFGEETYEDSATSVVDKQELTPRFFLLEQNFPNPFNQSTNIDFSINNRKSSARTG
jgi:hypothetical protein